MKLFSNRILSVAFTLFFSANLFNSVLAQDKPLLSEAIQETIGTQDVEAAKKHFSDMNQSRRSAFTVDMDAVAELTTQYIQDGNYEAASAVSEISAPFIQDMVFKSMNEYAPEMAEMMAEQQQAEEEEAQQTEQHREERAALQQKRIIESQGQPREDLDRFTGLYGDSEVENSTRRLWVTISCDGYLVSGAMWGDASPLWMRSESDNVFTYGDSFNKIRMEFTTGNGGNTVEMIHSLEFMKSPLTRIAPLPDDWDSCMERM